MSGVTELTIEAAWAASLAEGELRGLRVPTPDGVRWVLLARVAGRLHAIDDCCNHAGRLLSEGKLQGTTVTCPGHGVAFDVRDGRRVTPGVACGDQASLEVEEAGEGRLLLRVRAGG
jgi:nitrite reductase/ring-hydroxylating ferredoxin subunit